MKRLVSLFSMAILLAVFSSGCARQISSNGMVAFLQLPGPFRFASIFGGRGA